MDDHELSARALCMGLEALGYEVAVAHDGPAGLALLRALAPPPWAIVLDVCMPGMTGVEVMHAILRATPDARVVLTSALPWDHVSPLCADGPLPAAFLPKPVSLDDLADALDGLCP